MSRIDDLVKKLETYHRELGPLPIEWRDGKLRWLDVSRLPWEEKYVESDVVERVAEAIKRLEIRGAPAIGVAAALAVALAAFKARGGEEAVASAAKRAAELLARTRPTARNLFWALERMEKALREGSGSGAEALRERLLEEALKIQVEDVETNLKIGEYGEKLLEDGDRVLTHCNAGSLATAGHGTALGIIKTAWKKGKRIEVIATETRPLLQGARLTAWELAKEGIPFKLVVDGAVGYVFSARLVDKVIVGADRILLSGHVVNKIGTYMIAVLAARHGRDFYVAAPISTVDPRAGPSDIVIEVRDPEEVLTILDRVRVAPEKADALNPAFDVTPPELISAIVTERGVARHPRGSSLRRMLEHPPSE
ncbi:MAG: S-methyl-5-thioribose-1-phosphate isomerase [Fervidicoccaceae archaeon]